MRAAVMLVVAVAGTFAGAARAQRGGDVPRTDETLQPTQLDPTTCEKTRSTAARSQDIDIKDVAIVVNWKDYEITGDFVDPPATVRELMDPIMERNHLLTEEGRQQIEAAAASFGYQVVGLGTRDTPAGVNAHLHLAPLPMVRTLDVRVHYPGILDLFKPLLEDEIKRRMRSRVGSYLPWAPDQRNCKLYLEKRRIEEFLHDEGYFDAVATLDEAVSGVGVSITASVELGKEYKVDVDRIEIPGAGGFRVAEADIREKFRPQKKCVFVYFCVRGSARFTRSKHQDDLKEVVDLFHARGFPAVRVRSDFDPGVSIDRQRHTVQFQLTIDPRRQIDVEFEGDHTASNEALRTQLTFDQAASADDVEANNSARAITGFLQARGYFDARVTWRRESFPDAALDKIIYRIEQGRRRSVADVRFVGNHQRFASADLLKNAIATKERQLSSTILGATTYATSATLASDVDRIVTLYRRNGFRDVRVHVDASTDPQALGSAALTAALISANRGSDLFVQFSIDEGQPTVLTEVRIQFTDKTDVIPPGQDALCTEVLKDLAELYHHPAFAKQLPGNRCVAHVDGTAGMGVQQILTSLPFREEDAAATKDQLKNRMFARGRPRAEVAYEPVVLGPHSIAARYLLANTQQLTVGKVVLRGNFRTRPSIIYGELQLKEGQPLTTEALGESIRKLRNTALFESVNIHMPALQATSSGAVNAVVELTERYDYRASIDFETGYSSFNGAFVKAGPSFKNLFGIGASLDLSGTVGFDLGTLPDFTLRQLSAESTLRFPQWLPKHIGSPIDFQTEITGFKRRQDTPRFGVLRTTGATLALSHTKEYPRTVSRREAAAMTIGAHYDFRSRERNVDVLRPIGADDDDSQVPITTRTGLVGGTFEWEQRVDRAGSLSPLAPEGGFRFEAQVALASPIFLGQDTFAKVSAASSKFWSVGPHLVFRLDGRYDHGIPLGGAALLPEVERFFGGGDSTVRGYDDDRLATEIVQVGVPPLDNVTQIRVLPAGGNIRALASADAQLRVYRLLSTAVFADAGLITNQWTTVTLDDVRPSVGMALMRIVTPFGSFAFERAVPLRPRLGDDPRGRWHISFAARAQF